MAYVISEPCVGEKNTACVDACPVSCIHSDGGSQYYINPDECIDCGDCAPACPVGAIFPEHALPAQWKEYAARNRTFFLLRMSEIPGPSGDAYGSVNEEAQYRR